MQFTKLHRLRKAIQNLDTNFIAKRIDLLEEHLSHEGQVFDRENTALTEEGIFYMSTDTGMSTKVVLYHADHPGEDVAPRPDMGMLVTEGDAFVANWSQEFHILNCNTVRHLAAQGWKGNYRIAQRTDAAFSCLMPDNTRRRKRGKDPEQELKETKLSICANCHVKVKSLLEGVADAPRAGFDLKYFFDIDFTRSWSRHERTAYDPALQTIHPKDWTEITRIRKKQADYFCEGCEADLSHPQLRKFLFVHNTDHTKRKVRYIKLECLCLTCLSELPSYNHLREQPDFAVYQRMIAASSTYSTGTIQELSKNQSK